MGGVELPGWLRWVFAQRLCHPRRALPGQVSYEYLHPRSALTSADGDPGKKPPRDWADVLPAWPLGCAGAAPPSRWDSLGMKSDPQGGRRVGKLSQDQKGDGQMSHRGSTPSIWAQALGLHHIQAGVWKLSCLPYRPG